MKTLSLFFLLSTVPLAASVASDSQPPVVSPGPAWFLDGASQLQCRTVLGSLVFTDGNVAAGYLRINEPNTEGYLVDSPWPGHSVVAEGYCEAPTYTENPDEIQWVCGEVRSRFSHPLLSLVSVYRKRVYPGPRAVYSVSTYAKRLADGTLRPIFTSRHCALK